MDVKVHTETSMKRVLYICINGEYAHLCSRSQRLVSRVSSTFGNYRNVYNNSSCELFFLYKF